MIKGFSTFIALVCCTTLSEARPLSSDNGWRFDLSLNAGVVQGRSQFNTDDDNAITEDLNNSGQSTTNFIAYPFLRVQYTFNNLNSQFYLGNSRDQISTAQFQYELGFVHQFQDDTKFTLAAFPRLSLFNDTWADPFLEGSKRQTTKQNTGGGRLAIERLLGSPFAIKYALASSDVDNEQSGQGQSLDAADKSLLVRDSFYQRFELEMAFPLAKQVFVKPNLQYTQRNAEGEANSYDEFAGQLSFIVKRKQHFWITTVKAGQRLYKTENPIFNLKQDTNFAGIFSIYRYQDMFGFKDWNWTMIAGYKREDSLITFYDSLGLVLTSGVVYNF